MNKPLVIAVIKRFLRTVLPQVPAVLAYLSGVKPEWAAALAFLGAVVTALDKLFREVGFYNAVIGYINPKQA